MRTKGSVAKPRNLDPIDLRELLKPIHDRLVAKGVPEYRLPSNTALASHVLDWVDDNKVNAWIDAFAAAEGKK